MYHASYLYNVISQFVIDFYDWNHCHKNKALYLNRALYSLGILFQCGEVLFPCDVITCAAPNKSAAQNYHNVSDMENKEALRARIKFGTTHQCFQKVIFAIPKGREGNLEAFEKVFGA